MSHILGWQNKNVFQSCTFLRNLTTTILLSLVNVITSSFPTKILTIWEMNCAFPGDKSERESKMDQGTWSMCSKSLIKSFGSSHLQFLHKTWYLTSRNRCCNDQMISNNPGKYPYHLVRFWKLRQLQDHSNLGWIDGCTYFFFSCKFKQNK